MILTFLKSSGAKSSNSLNSAVGQSRSRKTTHRGFTADSYHIDVGLCSQILWQGKLTEQFVERLETQTKLRAWTWHG